MKSLGKFLKGGRYRGDQDQETTLRTPLVTPQHRQAVRRRQSEAVRTARAQQQKAIDKKISELKKIHPFLPMSYYIGTLEYYAPNQNVMTLLNLLSTVAEITKTIHQSGDTPQVLTEEKFYEITPAIRKQSTNVKFILYKFYKTYNQILCDWEKKKPATTPRIPQQQLTGGSAAAVGGGGRAVSRKITAQQVQQLSSRLDQLKTMYTKQKSDRLKQDLRRHAQQNMSQTSQQLDRVLQIFGNVQALDRHHGSHSLF